MKNVKRIIQLGVVVFCQASIACSKTPSVPPVPDPPRQDSIEIQVGTKIFKTTKRTSAGTPVVPMWNARMATVDLRTGAGFPVLNTAQHANVWQPATRED